MSSADRKTQVCSVCDCHSSNVVGLTCGHKICISCIQKIELSSKNCLVCNSDLPHKNWTDLSPEQDSHHMFQEPKTLKQKILHRVREPSTSHKASNHSPARSYNASRQDSQRKISTNLLPRQQPSLCQLNTNLSILKPIEQGTISCREHGEPLIMFGQKNKQFYCAQCLYYKNLGVRSSQVVPIKYAFEQLIRQNKLNREDSRRDLENVETAIKACHYNRELFDSARLQYSQIIQNEFDEIRRVLSERQKTVEQNMNSLLDIRISEYDKILEDLQFLKSSIKEYRQFNNKENTTLNATVYLFSAYKVIRKTMKTLDLNYHTYSTTDMLLCDFDSRKMVSAINQFARIKTDLPIKFQHRQQRRIGSAQRSKKNSSQHMHSIQEQLEVSMFRGNEGLTGRNISGSTQHHKATPPRPKRPAKEQNSSIAAPSHKGSLTEGKPSRRAQYSLSSNLYEAPEKNLYEKLLNQKFNSKFKG